jgi:hypothetical protein
MVVIRKPGGELKAFIQWNGRWRNVYIISSFDQMSLLGEPVRMIEFKLTKRDKETHVSEKINFHKNKPAVQSGRKGVAA